MDTTARLIAVTGATGRQGGAVARHLLAGGWRVRGITRKPQGDAARALASVGAEIVGADMADPGIAPPRVPQLSYGVFSVQNPMISGHEGEIAQGRNVADAAKALGVEHVVYGSAGVGVPTGVPSWDSRLPCTGARSRLGLPLTVLRPTAFMELMTDKGFFPPVTAWHSCRSLIGGDRALPWLCVDDVGAITARVFADPERFVGTDLDVAADLMTLDECRTTGGRSPVGRRADFRCRCGCFSGSSAATCLRCWRWAAQQPGACRSCADLRGPSQRVDCARLAEPPTTAKLDRLTPNKIAVRVEQALPPRARRARSDRTVVDHGHRDELADRAGDEHLVSAVQVEQRQSVLPR